MRVLLVAGIIAASAPVALAQAQATEPTDNRAAKQALLAQNYGKLPLSFEANQGQSDKSAKFLSKGSGYSLFLTESSAVLALTKPDASGAEPGRAGGDGLKPAPTQRAGKTDSRRTDVVRMDLAGANRGVQVTGLDRLPGTANYFIGNDPAKWHSGVPTFARVKYTAVYPGIDLVYYGNQRQLEYDFVVAPGANAQPIRLQFAGTKKLKLDADGNLTVSAANGEIAFQKPVIYQVKDGLRQPIVGQFAMLAKNTVGFTLGQYDHSKTLVIDPVLTYSTYLGGSLADGANGIAVDSFGNAYVVGSTFSTNFPVTAGAFQSVNNEPSNFQCVFVSKLNPTGTALVYSTYLGGSGNTGNVAQFGDVGYGIAVDGSGDAYVTGLTQSTSFPITTGAFQTVNNSTLSLGPWNAFVTKLNATGTALVYSTYLGGTSQDYASAIAVDSLGNAYVTGAAVSANFPVTAGAFQVINHASTSWNNAFVTKLNPTGTALVYSTYLGGTGYGAKGAGIAVDNSDDAYVTGSAASTDFPITNGAFQNTNYAAANAGLQTVAYNVFVTKLNPTGTQLVYSTFVGGTTDDFGQAIALDGAGDAYVTGYTDSKDYPVAGNAYQPTNLAWANEATAAFVTEVNPTGSALVYSTFLSGSGIPPQACGSGCTESGSGDAGNAIAVDGLGDAYVTGDAISSNFPTTSGAYQTVNNSAGNRTPIGVNAFITKLNPGGSQLLYSTYLGGNVQDLGYGIALDGLGGVYVAGQTASQNFPTTAGSYQPAYAGGYSDAYIAKFAIGSVPTTIGTTTSLISSANPQVQGSSVTFTATVAPASGTGIPTGNVVFSVDSVSTSTVALNGSGVATYPTSSLTAGQHTILASYGGSTAYASSSNSLTQTISQPQAAAPVFSPAVGTYTSTQSVTITDSTTGATIYYTSNGNPPTTSSTMYSVAIPVSSTETIEAIAVAAGYTNSVVASGTYTINLAAAASPVFSPTAATYTSTQSVTIADSTTGATIYYTTNGTTPTTSSTLYNGAITVSTTETIEAIAVASGYSNSAVASATYTITVTPQAATPVFSPAAGSYTSTQSVTIADSTTGATIYYTTNGTTPTTSSTLYSGAITVSGTETVEAIAVASGYSNSAVASATYTITVTPQAATPVFSPAAGSYTSTQSVTIADSTTGAAIYYTTNGTTPTASSTLYNGAITVSTTETIEAIAVASGFSNSAVATAAYVIVVVAPGYTLSANPSSLTIQSGSSASTVITLTPTGGFTGTVDFACGTLPTLVTCTFVPTSLTVTSSTTSLTTTLTIGTTGTPTAALIKEPAGTALPALLAAVILLPLGLARRILRTRKAGSQWLGLLLLAGTCLAGACVLGTAGCGGSGKKSTSAGSYSIPISVTGNGVTNSLNLSITVQ
jgi:hypothetical protein